MNTTSTQTPTQTTQDSGGSLGSDQARDAIGMPPSRQSQAPQMPVSAGGKEVEPVAYSTEAVPLVEVSKSAELAPEVASWMEQVEKAQDVHLTQPVVQDDAVLVADPSAQVVDDRVILPLTVDQIESAQKHKVGESVRWLAEWCIRLTKVFRAKEMSSEAKT